MNAVQPLSIETSTSYATEKNLLRALEQKGVDKLHRVVVRNSQGRWTAIFPFSRIQGTTNPFLLASLGFMVLG